VLDPEPAQLVLPLARQPAAGEHVVRTPRMRTLLAGKLVYGQESYTIDCAVRDISSGGAKITLSGRQSLPPELFLIVARRGIAYRAKIAWSNYPARGLRFLETIPLNTTLPENLKFLRKLWMELATRTGVEIEEPDAATGPSHF
jgi:hypothetical protein